MFFQILVSAGASNVMLVTLLMPFSALFLGNAFLDEPIRTQEIAGALIIGLGLLFIDGRVLRVIQRIRYNLCYQRALIATHGRTVRDGPSGLLRTRLTC